MYQQIDARPTVVDLKVYAGDDLHLRLDIYDIGGNPEDLTGAAAQAQVRATPDAETVLAEFTAEIDGSTIWLHLAAADTATLPATAVWDVQVTYLDPDITVATLARGGLATTAEVTR